MYFLRRLLPGGALFSVLHSALFALPARAVEEDQEIRRADRGEYGIGVRIAMKDGQIVISETMKGSPAEKAGILPGAGVLMVDGRSLRNLRSADEADWPTGCKGEPATVSVRHKDGGRIVVHHLKREYRWK